MGLLLRVLVTMGATQPGGVLHGSDSHRAVLGLAVQFA